MVGAGGGVECRGVQLERDGEKKETEINRVKRRVR